MAKNQYWRIPLAMFVTAMIYMYLGLVFVIVAIALVTVLALIPDARGKEQEEVYHEQ